jgi:hypothetical protein
MHLNTKKKYVLGLIKDIIEIRELKKQVTTDLTDNPDATLGGDRLNRVQNWIAGLFFLILVACTIFNVSISLQILIATIFLLLVIDSRIAAITSTMLRRVGVINLVSEERRIVQELRKWKLDAVSSIGDITKVYKSYLENQEYIYRDPETVAEQEFVQYVVEKIEASDD